MYPVSSRVHVHAVTSTSRWRLGRGLRFRKGRLISPPARRGLSAGDATAIFALLVAAGTFYLTYFHVKHSLKVTVARFAPDSTQLPTRLTGDVALLNHGNRTETLLNAELVVRGYGAISDPELPKKTLVIKPGDTEPLKINWLINAGDLDLIRTVEGGGSATLPVELRLTSVSETAGPIETVVPMGTLMYHRALNTLRFSAARQDIRGRLIELINRS